MSTTTAVVALGHDNIRGTLGGARQAIEGVLRVNDADILTKAAGAGVWEETPEPCEVWIVTLPAARVWSLAADLEELADILNQDAIGLIIHDHATRPLSYVERRPA